ncbi:MAG: PAS domain S-box protein [Thermoflexales bacterium]|nr:PAS domain S-box protein [Thermoflexales bacterium]
MLPDYRVRQRDYLLDILQAITSRLDLNEVLRLVAQAAVDVMTGNAAMIALVEPAGRIRIRESIGLSRHALETLGAGIERASEDPGAPVDDGTGDEAPTRALVREAGLRSLEMMLPRVIAPNAGLLEWIALPLSIGEDFLGQLYVLRRRGGEFSPNDRQVLQSFADQAAIAVNNARLYQQVNAQKQRLDAILESTADGVAIMDGSHRVVLWNRALAALSGVPAGEALGRDFEAAIRLSDKRAGSTLTEAEANGWPLVGATRPLFVEGDIERPDGAAVSVEITFAPIFAREALLVNIVANVRDITRFREADRLKSTFVSVVSHELKTPVALIKGYASTLRRPDARWDEKTIDDSLGVIEDESDRLAELIDNLLDASRAQAGSFRLARNEMDLDALVTEIVQRHRSQATRHTLTADVPGDLPLVFADHARITQVISNLLSNAIKYSPDGGEVKVTSRVTPGEVIISVTDPGPGIAPEMQSQLFTRFHRLENALTQRTPGTGLGLYLCKSIIEAHGGRIWVDSDGQHGSTFSFSLPRA